MMTFVRLLTAVVAAATLVLGYELFGSGWVLLFATGAVVVVPALGRVR